MESWVTMESYTRIFQLFVTCAAGWGTRTTGAAFPKRNRVRTAATAHFSRSTSWRSVGLVEGRGWNQRWRRRYRNFRWRRAGSPLRRPAAVPEWNLGLSRLGSGSRSGVFSSNQLVLLTLKLSIF